MSKENFKEMTTIKFSVRARLMFCPSLLFCISHFQCTIMCGSRKYPSHPKDGLLKISGVIGVGGGGGGGKGKMWDRIR